MKILFIPHEHFPTWMSPLDVEVVTSDRLREDGDFGMHQIVPKSVEGLAERIIKNLKPDVVVGEAAAGFWWGSVIKLVRPELPQYIIPRAMCFSPWYALGTLIFSQLAGSNDWVIAGAKSTAWAFRKFGLNAAEFELPGVDIDLFFRESKKHNVENLPYFIFAGRVAPDRDILGALSMFDRLKKEFNHNIRFVICTHIWYEDYLQKCLEKAKDIGQVEFRFNVSHHELASLYAGANAYFSTGPTIFETFGRSVVEALASGTPVIAPRFMGVLDHLPIPQCVAVKLVERQGFLYFDEDDFLDKACRLIRFPPPKLSIKERRKILQPYSLQQSLLDFRQLLQVQKPPISKRNIETRIDLERYEQPVSKLWAALKDASINDICNQVMERGPADMLTSWSIENKRDYYKYLYQDYFLF